MMNIPCFGSALPLLDISANVLSTSSSTREIVAPTSPPNFLAQPGHHSVSVSIASSLASSTRLGGDGDLDLDTGLDVDDDLLDDLGGGVEAGERGKKTHR